MEKIDKDYKKTKMKYLDLFNRDVAGTSSFSRKQMLKSGMDEKGVGECHTHALSQSLLVWNVLPHNPSVIWRENRPPVVYRCKGKDKAKQKTYVDGEGDFGALSRGRGLVMLLKQTVTLSTMKFV